MIATAPRLRERFFRRPRLVSGTALGLAGAPGPALAHAFGERYDLPLPLGLFLAGAGATVALTFVALALLRRGPGESRPRLVLALGGARPGRVARALGAGLRGLSVLAFCFLCYAGFFGTQETLHNIVPTLLWVGLWVGMAYLAALLGNPWRLINPYGVLFDWAYRTVRILRRGRVPGRRPAYPRRLGAWPAAAGLLLLAWIELVSEGGERPALLAAGMLAYGAYLFAGMAAFGRDVWLEHADVFTVAFGVLGRFAPLGPRDPERAPGNRGWVLRPPGSGLLGTAPVSLSMTVFVLLMLSNVTFDGFLETPLWNGVLEAVATSGALRPVLLDLQSSGVDLLALLKSIGLVAFLGIFAAVYVFSGLLMSRAAGGGLAAVEMCRWFVLTLVPIAIAYHLAHYASFFALAGQLLIPLASDPLGRGWDLFGTAHVYVDVSVISARLVWYTSLVTIVLGHVFAVVLAHLQARRIFENDRSVLMSQLPMLALMVGYTLTSLWILSQPVVKTQVAG